MKVYPPFFSISQALLGPGDVSDCLTSEMRAGYRKTGKLILYDIKTFNVYEDLSRALQKKSTHLSEKKHTIIEQVKDELVVERHGVYAPVILCEKV